jgi:hypothetical protein
MSSAQLETFLARLYTDEAWRSQFLANPEATARAAGLMEADVSALAAIDRTGLQMAAMSFAHKREARRRNKPFLTVLRRLGLVRDKSAK